MNEREQIRDVLTKVPAVTLGFWIIKILATTLGETGGDSVHHDLAGETTPQSHAERLSDRNYDLRGVARPARLGADQGQKLQPVALLGDDRGLDTAGTTMADFADRSLGIGYPGGSLLLLSCVLLSLFTWYRSLGSININTVATPKAETFYWITITFSQTLGTALGDWIADAGLAIRVARWCSARPWRSLRSSISRRR